MVARTWRPRGERGHSFLELLVTTILLSVLASAVLPLAAVSRKREKEIELRRALREIRVALDMYHEICRQSVVAKPPAGAGTPTQTQQIIIKVEDDPGRTCWPKDLDLLVEGVETNIARYKLRFLRRIPADPFNTDQEERDAYGWKLLSTTDKPDGNVGWNRQNVFDVRSGSMSQALDGSFYKEW
jgi:general secretion pathway protein G